MSDRHDGPDFLCIGAQAGGTSWLYRQLKRHPDFKFPFRKEVHYFDTVNASRKRPGAVARIRSILDSSDNLVDAFKLLLSRQKRKYRKRKHGAPNAYKADGRLKKKKIIPESDSSYLENFRSKRITGDITPAYSTLPDASVERMAQLLPDAKIVFLLRNPVERNWSAYRKKLKKAVFQEYTLLEMKHFFNKEGVVKRTAYLDTIDRYTHYFGKENVLIGFYDAIIEQPDQLLAEIVDFLGGDAEAKRPQQLLTKVVNESPKMAIPEEVERFLEDKYVDLIEELAARYGSYATRWLHRLQRTEQAGADVRATVRI